MRIAFYAPMKSPLSPRPSGDRQIARHLLAALERGGHAPEVVSNFRSWEGDGDRARQQRLEKVGKQLAARLTRRLQARPANARPEAWLTYHLYHKAPDWLGPIVSSNLEIPYYLAEASSAPKQADGPWSHGYTAANAAIRQAKGIFLLNPRDRPELERLVAGAHRIAEVAPFLDSAPFVAASRHRTEHRAALQQHLGLPGDSCILLAVGMFRPGDKQDSYDCLGQALETLTDLPWHLVIVGDGPNRNAVKATLANLPSERVHLLGTKPPDALSPIYAAADLLVWPAVREAIGMALLEAQAAGTPVVAGTAGAVPLIVTHRETGLLSPVGDPNALANNLRTLLDDPERRSRMRAAALTKTADQHSLDSAAVTLNAVLRPSRDTC